MLGFSKTQASALSELLARKKFGKAIEILRAELQARGRDTRVRMQLADVLQRAGRADEAVPLLLEAADDFALSGGAGKAIAALKRAQAISPGRPEIESHLAYLIAQQKAPTPDPWQRAKARIDAGGAGPELNPSPAQSFLGDMEEISEQPVLPTPPPAPPASPAAPAPPRPASPAAPEGLEGMSFGAVEAGHLPGHLDLDEPSPLAKAAAAAGTAVDDAAGNATEEEFVDEVIALVDDVLTGRLPAARAELAAVPAVEMPLFREFSCEELVEVIRGLRLRSFAPGEIVVSEGEDGNSLFVLTSGTVRTYVRGARGHNAEVRVLREGDFFGEVSLLHAEGRTATITAASRCELLEIDRPTLDEISRTHPRIWDVIRRFSQARAGSQAELSARAQGPS